MKSIKIIIVAVGFVTAMFTVGSCKKGDTQGTMYNVRMTDGPGPYSQVNVEITAVQVIRTDGSVVTLNTHAGVYNLLRFTNGMDTLIASGNVSVGVIQNVRLVLGGNNTIVLNGSTYPIAINSGDDAGLTLSVHQTVQTNTTTDLLIDFDANQSIVTDNGGSSYHLRPVLRAVDLDVSTTGSIKGHITPDHTPVVITVSGNGSVFSSGQADDGNFKIKGLTGGTYSVTITPPSPLVPITIPNVVVTAGSTTDVGLVAF